MTTRCLYWISLVAVCTLLLSIQIVVASAKVLRGEKKDNPQHRQSQPQPAHNVTRDLQASSKALGSNLGRGGQARFRKTGFRRRRRRNPFDADGNLLPTAAPVATPSPTPRPTPRPTQRMTRPPSTPSPTRTPLTFPPTVSPTPYPPAENDLCRNAIPLELNNELVVGVTNGATVDPTGQCNLINSQSPGVWYRVPGVGGNVIASTCQPETEFDTALSVFRSCNFECLSANDDFTNCGRTSVVSFPTQRNRFYYIHVHGFGTGSIGRFGLRVRSAIPLNDRCQEAGPILNVGDTVRGSTFQATDDFRGAVFNCGTSVGDTPGVWHRVRGTGGRMTADTCGEFTNYDTKIAVFNGNCPGLGSGNCIVGNNDFDACDKKSFVSWRSNQGRIYYIHIHGFLGDNGDYELRIGE